MSGSIIGAIRGIRRVKTGGLPKKLVRASLSLCGSFDVGFSQQ